MGRLANISGKEAVRAFEKSGWHREGQVGSHLVMTKPGVRVSVLPVCNWQGRRMEKMPGNSRSVGAHASPAGCKPAAR